MEPLSESTTNVLVFALAALAVAGLYGFLRWFQAAPSQQDPWDTETGVDLEAQDTRPLCTRCLTSHEETDWFCAKCGKAVSPTTNLMPYLDNLSIGDVLRQGTAGNIPVRPVMVLGYALFGLTQYGIFVPLYWWRLWRNVTRLQGESARPSEQAPAA